MAFGSRQPSAPAKAERSSGSIPAPEKIYRRLPRSHRNPGARAAGPIFAGWRIADLARGPRSILRRSATKINRKQVTAALLTDFPAHIRAYDLLGLDGQDLRALPLPNGGSARGFCRRGAPRAPRSVAADRFRLVGCPRRSAARPGCRRRRRRRHCDRGRDAEASGFDLRSGPAQGPLVKWKRDPFAVDAVLMYAQRGHGKRSSFYSDFTFGLWRAGSDGDEIVPVGKAYFGFTDDELRLLDRYVRNHTTNRFGPVREVAMGRTKVWCWRSRLTA